MYWLPIALLLTSGTARHRRDAEHCHRRRERIVLARWRRPDTGDFPDWGQSG